MIPRLLLPLLLAAVAPSKCGGTDAPAPAEISTASFGARGDGQTDDTAALQSAIDAVKPGGTLRFPPGTYRIATDRGLVLKDDMRLELEGATLTGPNVNGARCRLLEVQGRRNVTIRGGTLVGSRVGTPQWGVGILASDADDLVIEGVTLRDFFFDGILLTGNRGCRRVRIRHVTAENNRRTGLAAPAAMDLTVEDSVFRGSRGQSPQAGANCEPNAGGEVRQVRFLRSTFADNAGVGLYIHRALGVAVSEATVEDNVMTGNEHGIVASGVSDVTIRRNRVSGHRARVRSGIALGDETTRALVADNVLEDNFRGIVSAGATAVEIRGNTIVGTGTAGDAKAGEDGDGIVCRGLRGLLQGACVVARNVVRRTAGSGIAAHLVSRVEISDNRVEDAGQRGILLRSATDSEVRDNQVLRAGTESRQRYDAIELSASANDNLVTQNVCHLGPETRSAVLIGPGCLRNRVFGNVSVPWTGSASLPPSHVPRHVLFGRRPCCPS
jgi:parallel beta-helix repeat protein